MYVAYMCARARARVCVRGGGGGGGGGGGYVCLDTKTERDFSTVYSSCFMEKGSNPYITKVIQ